MVKLWNQAEQAQAYASPMRLSSSRTSSSTAAGRQLVLAPSLVLEGRLWKSRRSHGRSSSPVGNKSIRAVIRSRARSVVVTQEALRTERRAIEDVSVVRNSGKGEATGAGNRLRQSRCSTTKSLSVSKRLSGNV